MRMTKEELIFKLKNLIDSADSEDAHIEADNALVEFIGDPDIAIAFSEIRKWYA